MPALNCSATTCIYNKNELCSKGDIEVGGSGAKTPEETCCKSFRERGMDSYTNSAADGCGCTKIGVDCQATNCMYNESCKCMAGGIEIKGQDAEKSGDTKCGSFRCSCE